ncbi:MAG: hypothetical protein HYX71_08570 [Opitutae bacterium]|nr:hypothetical protein [Opitutae bacterium]
MNYDKVPELPDEPVNPARGRARRRLGIVAVGAIAAAAAYWQFGREPAAPTAEQKTRAGGVVRLEERLEGLRTQLSALPKNAASAERRALLEEALARQSELLKLRAAPVTADSVQLGAWQAQRDNLVAAEQSRLSRELEEAAELLRRQKQTAAAVEKFQEALRLQLEVNRSMAAREFKSYGREARLRQQIEELGAEPLLAEATRWLAAARAAVAGGSWADAVRSYGRAGEIQQQLAREFPRSRFSAVLADGRIEAELASLGATEAQAQLRSFLQKAAAAAARGDLAAADKSYALAADRQQAINTEFPNSRFVSMEQLERIEVTRQTLRLRPVLEQVRALDGRVAGHLRRRELFQAQQFIAEALTALEAAITQSPKAEGTDEELRERLGYLALRSADLAFVQDQTYELLLPLPARPQSALLKRAVPQALFAAVMNTNPSRTPGRNRPVDSVSEPEAREFCRRLGWVLGAATRLPTAGELAGAARDPGFMDPAGGLDEWLAAEAGGNASTAPLHGAHGVDKVAPKAERGRTTGFRVVVAVDLLAPVAR